MSRLTLMVARSKSFITATPSYCSWSRSCETKTQRAQTKYVAGQATTRRANEAEKGNATWYSNCNVSKWTPMNLAFTSNTPTVSDGEISKMAFLNLRWEKSRRRLFKAEERQTSNLGLFMKLTVYVISCTTHWLGCRSSMEISTPFSCRRAAVYFWETCLLFLALLSPGFFDNLRRKTHKCTIKAALSTDFKAHYCILGCDMQTLKTLKPMLHGHHAADDASQVANVHLNGGKEQRFMLYVTTAISSHSQSSNSQKTNKKTASWFKFDRAAHATACVSVMGGYEPQTSACANERSHWAEDENKPEGCPSGQVHVQFLFLCPPQVCRGKTCGTIKRSFCHTNSERRCRAGQEHLWSPRKRLWSSTCLEPSEATMAH